MASHYSTQQKAEVIDMSRQGNTSVQIGKETGLPVSTVGDWVRAARDLAIAEDRDPLLVNGEYRLAFLGQVIQQSQLAELLAMIERGESTLKYGLLTNVIKGTSMDKAHNALRHPPPTIQAQNVLIVLNAKEPGNAIEGEVVE